MVNYYSLLVFAFWYAEEVWPKPLELLEEIELLQRVELLYYNFLFMHGAVWVVRAVEFVWYSGKYMKRVLRVALVSIVWRSIWFPSRFAELLPCPFCQGLHSYESMGGVGG